jgi:RNA polymerase sigma-70 factor, ECF subfamily
MTQSEFELIVRNHQSMVYSIAFNFFGNPGLAEEIAQDVFLRLYEDRITPKSEQHVVSWLRRVTAHRCIDVLRHRHLQSEVNIDDLPEIAARSREADPLLEERLRRLVGSLPAKQRMAVILRYGEDMDVEEIGRMLDIPVRTVWTYLQRAIEFMREKASRYLKEEKSGPTR